MNDTAEQPYVRTTYAVWELTLKCNLKCIHCGSRAGDARPVELTTAEAIDLVHQLAELGVREVTLLGGESFLRPDWLDIASEISRSGMLLTMTTGGYGLGPKMAKKMAKAGFKMVSISIDGLEQTHDYLRGRQRSWEWCFKAVRALQDAGIRVSANTQLNRLSAPELPLLYQHLHRAGVITWQLQMTVPMGNAADHSELLLQPYELLDVFPMIHHLVQISQEQRPRVVPSNNLGYYGPYERRFRSHPHTDNPELMFWNGCRGGVLTLGIESDGDIKADPSLPTDDYVGGNIRDKSLRQIVYESEQLAINDDRGIEHMWGFCRSCEFAEICRGGDTWTAHVFFDRRGNNPYCHHRSLLHAARGQREKLDLKVRAEGVPFDNGIFDLAVEADDAPLADDHNGFSAAKIQWPEDWLKADPELPARLIAERDRSIEVWRRTRLPRAAPSIEASGPTTVARPHMRTNRTAESAAPVAAERP
ncbi:MAG: radical SAM protein [Myxococcota bacterium]